MVQERTLDYSLHRPSAYKPNVKSTERFSHTFSILSKRMEPIR